MKKEEITAMVAQILGEMNLREPMVKGSDYKPANPGPQPRENHHHSGEFVPDVTELDLRKLYLTENAVDAERPVGVYLFAQERIYKTLRDETIHLGAKPTFKANILEVRRAHCVLDRYCV